MGERHAVERDLHHVAQPLAKCAEQLDQLAPAAERYGVSPPARDVGESPRLHGELRRKSADLLGRSEVTGLMLLGDLRDLYLDAQRAELAWVVLVQVAQAVRDRDLLEVATAGREHAETTGKWVRTRTKETGPQVLATG